MLLSGWLEPNPSQWRERYSSLLILKNKYMFLSFLIHAMLNTVPVDLWLWSSYLKTYQQTWEELEISNRWYYCAKPSVHDHLVPVHDHFVQGYVHSIDLNFWSCSSWLWIQILNLYKPSHMRLIPFVVKNLNENQCLFFLFLCFLLLLLLFKVYWLCYNSKTYN